ncbi:glycosyltransferase [Paractinoplanes globisporus]|uniref:Glycosyltransferase n=1 Tax=Paractinoplanes globisporus TaxID=113565 RepID=A0ABW6W4L6_9ACTN|nr:glycosyltransferase [Actinoplanes globisporus]
MRVLIVTSGSVGDVAPYAGLGARLRDAGHAVTLATHEPFRAAVERAGLEFAPLPGDLRATLAHALGGMGPRALGRQFRLARPLIASLGQGIAAAAAAVRPDAMLLSTMVAPLGYQVAEAYGIRRAGVFLQPVQPTREFGSVLLGGRSLGPVGNRVAGRVASRGIQPLYAGPIRELRRELGLPAVPLAELRQRQELREPTFHGFSPAIVPRPEDWPPQLEVTGYWWPAEDKDWRPPPALEAFLAAGTPPVFVGFGSMAPGQGRRLGEIVGAAVRRAGVRAVVQAGWSELAAGDGDDVLGIGAAPHSWLFPRVAAVVHHAGAGTTAAGLRAGVPAVAVPVLADQPFWARRLHDLGAAPRPIPMPALTAEALAAALCRVTGNPHYAARAQALQARVNAEDGAAPIRKWIG